MTDPVRVEPYEAARHGDGPWRVVAAVFEEYGFPFAAFGYDADLRAPDRWYPPDRGGLAVAVAVSGAVVGCIAVEGRPGDLFEIHRLYVLREYRRRGIGTHLLRWALDRAKVLGATTVVAYSDIAFLDAHRLYERLGFQRFRFRYAPDPWQSREWGFRLALGAPHSQAAPPTASEWEAASCRPSAKTSCRNTV